MSHVPQGYKTVSKIYRHVQSKNAESDVHEGRCLGDESLLEGK